MNRAAQGRNTDEVPSNLSNSFQAIQTPDRTSQSLGLNQQESYLTSALSQDKASLTEVFQRIKIAGDFQDLSHIEDLEESVAPLLRALIIREKYDFHFSVCISSVFFSYRYMAFSLQSFPKTVENFLTKTLEEYDQSRRTSSSLVRPHNGSDTVL